MLTKRRIFDKITSALNKLAFREILTLVSGAFAIIFSLFGLLINPKKETEQANIAEKNKILMIESYRRELELQNILLKSKQLDLDRAQSQLEFEKAIALQNRTNNKDKYYQDLILIKNSVDKSILKLDTLKKRFEKIENIIIRSPNEALEIPLIKREIEDNKIYNQLKFDNMNKEIERVNNTIFVSLVALAVSIFAPALSSLFQRRKNVSDGKTEG